MVSFVTVYLYLQEARIKANGKYMIPEKAFGGLVCPSDSNLSVRLNLDRIAWWSEEPECNAVPPPRGVQRHRRDCDVNEHTVTNKSS